MSSHKSSVVALTSAAIGIVYGDIDTSSLYTMKEAFAKTYYLALNEPNAIAVVSLIPWGLIVIISLKYMTLVLRTDNRGEGGIMALTALALTSVTRKSRGYYPIMLLGMIGPDCALAMAPSHRPFRFSRQSKDWRAQRLRRSHMGFHKYQWFLLGCIWRRVGATAGIGKWLRPIMLAWFVALAIRGIINISGWHWRERLYIRVATNMRDAADYFKIPTNRVIELGAKVEI